MKAECRTDAPGYHYDASWDAEVEEDTEQDYSEFLEDFDYHDIIGDIDGIDKLLYMLATSEPHKVYPDINDLYKMLGDIQTELCKHTLYAFDRRGR